jgi:hypothetical protein
MIPLKCAQGIMNKVASSDHNWHIEDESNVELKGRYEGGAAVRAL